MSFKYQAIKDGPSRYVLPKLASMNVEVVAFLSDDLYAGTDEGLWSQAVTAASYPGVKGVYLQPDTHLGYSVPIGCVIVRLCLR